MVYVTFKFIIKTQKLKKVMEKESKNIDKITRSIIKDGGLHKPSANFFTNVMEAIEAQSVSPSVAYKPLISKTNWTLLFIFTAIVLVLLFIFPVFSETTIFSQLTIPEGFNFEINLPQIKLSKTTLYGIGFLSLFLIQIPILKRQLEKY